MSNDFDKWLQREYGLTVKQLHKDGDNALLAAHERWMKERHSDPFRVEWQVVLGAIIVLGCAVVSSGCWR